MAAWVALRQEQVLTLDTTTRRRIPAWIVFLMLLFAVPFWGLQYKLSLYHSVAETQAMPAAKLLSQKERPAADPHLERLASPEEHSRVAMHTFNTGFWRALLLYALLSAAFPVAFFLVVDETPCAVGPVVSRVGPRPPPVFA